MNNFICRCGDEFEINENFAFLICKCGFGMSLGKYKFYNIKYNGFKLKMISNTNALFIYNNLTSCVDITLIKTQNDLVNLLFNLINNIEFI